MILVCSKKEDLSAKRVENKLMRQSEVFHLFMDDYLSYQPQLVIFDGVFHNKINVDLSKISAIYFRALIFPYLPKTNMPEMYRNFLDRELITMFLGQLMTSKAKWVNHPFYSHLANYKIPQLNKAKEIEFDVPDTCIAVNRKILFDFYNQKKDQGSDIITKAIYSGYIQSNNPDEDEIMFTQEVILDSINDIPDKKPLLFQERIVPDYEIRCFVINNKVLSVKVKAEEPYIDYREINSKNIKAEVLVLPNRQIEYCIELTRKFNLEYSAIDLVFKNGKYFFLDFNPTGEWWWYEDNTNLPISQSLADLLQEI